MLSLNKKVKNNDIFRIPVYNMDMRWDEIILQYPNIVNDMDGSDVGSFLLVYYKKNPVNGIYEFVDEDAEADMTDIFGFDFDICTKGESKNEKFERNVEEGHILKIYDTFDNLLIEDNSENYLNDFELLEEFDEIKEKINIKDKKENCKKEKQARRQKILEEKIKNSI